MILGCEGLGEYFGLHSLEEVPVRPIGTGLLHQSACTFPARVGYKCGRWKGEDWCESGALSSDGTESYSDDVALVNKPDNKEEVTGDSCGLCTDDREGIALYIDLPCSPCKDSAEFAYIKSPEQFLLAEGPKGGTAGSALPRRSHERLKMTSQADVSQRSEIKLPSTMTSHALRALLGTSQAEVSQGSEMKLPSSMTHALRASLGTSQAEVSQGSEIKLPSSMTPHALRALLETDMVPRFQRWRQVTAIDQNPESASYTIKKREMLPNLKMSASPPVKERLLQSVPGRDVKAGPAESDFMKDSGDDQHRNRCQGESPRLISEETEAKNPLNVAHASRSLMEAEDVQKLKRRRLTSPADLALIKDSKYFCDGNSPDFVRRQPSDLPLAKETKCTEGSDSDGLQVRRTSAQSDSAHSTMDNAGSGECTSETASSGVLKVKSGPNGDSSEALSHSHGKSDTDNDSYESPYHSHDREALDKYLARPPRCFPGGSTDAFSRKKKEWLGQHYGGNQGETTGSAQDKSFAGNVGKFYRSAIDKRPAAPHPGFVGDGATVQLCRVCGEREDATNSLICDFCEQVSHMGCINVRMKIIPRVDEWLCRPCKRTRKMVRESRNQNGSDPGEESKHWWREDSRIGRVERELLRMSNGRRIKVRIGPKFQAGVSEWTGKEDEVDLDDNLAETSYRFGEEIALTSEGKRLEQETAEYYLANNIWPKGWLPATELSPCSKENWIQCTLVLFEAGEICPDGSTAEKNIVCGKWRRAPLGIVPDDQWECSCALVWDPRHADCAVLQELSTKEIEGRMKS